MAVKPKLFNTCKVLRVEPVWHTINKMVATNITIFILQIFMLRMQNLYVLSILYAEEMALWI